MSVVTTWDDTADTHPDWFVEANPPSATVRRLLEQGREKAAVDEYHIQLCAAQMGLSASQFKRQFASIIERERRQTGEAVVYFIGRSTSPQDDEPVKIGIARDVSKRMANLQSSSPDTLHLLATVEGGRDREADLHIRFSDSRIRGEWFRMTDELRAFIDAHRRPGSLDAL